jgi:hypothetical protein
MKPLFVFQFSAGGYDFYQHETDSRWQCVRAGSAPPNPRQGGYCLVDSLANLKGVSLNLLPESGRN